MTRPTRSRRGRKARTSRKREVIVVDGYLGVDIALMPPQRGLPDCWWARLYLKEGRRKVGLYDVLAHSREQALAVLTIGTVQYIGLEHLPPSRAKGRTAK